MEGQERKLGSPFFHFVGGYLNYTGLYFGESAGFGDCRDSCSFPERPSAPGDPSGRRGVHDEKNRSGKEQEIRLHLSGKSLGAHFFM